MSEVTTSRLRWVVASTVLLAAAAQVAFQTGKIGVPAHMVAPGGAHHNNGPHIQPPIPHAPVHHQTSKNVGISEKVLDGHIEDLVWATKDGLTLFLLTSKRTLYRSTDGGKTWANQMDSIRRLHSGHHRFREHLTHGQHEINGVTSIIKNDHVIIFLADHGMHVLTRDAGRTYTPIYHPDRLAEFKLHPTRSNMLLASVLTRRCYTHEAEGHCYKNLLMSSDHGETWRHIQDYVVQYEWAHSLKSHASQYPEDAIFASLHGKEHKHGVHQHFGKWDDRVEFVVSVDSFLTHEVLVPRGNRFLFTEKYLIVAQVNPASSSNYYAGAENGGTVTLQMSSDGGRKFMAAELEYPMTQHSYTILDTSNEAIFLHVNHHGETAKWGNVYISNAIGTNFSLTLPHNRRDANGKCDFEKLQSMEGVYVANYYENVAELEEYDRAMYESMGQSIAGRTDEEQAHNPAELPAPTPQVRTVITFDRGGSWEYLTPPRKDAHGKPVSCATAAHPQDGGRRPHCSLHLHGVTDVFGPFYSSANAVGMLMATGNVGSELTFKEGLVNTFLSRDGGHEWFEVAKGSHIYEFGDHGGIIVMANDEKEVTEIQYSWNEGMTWETLHFSSHPVLVDNIMIEPRGASERFILYGTRPDPAALHGGAGEVGARVGVVFALDFTQLHMRECTGEDAAGTDASDYERWAPSATSKGDGCLLGRRVEYTRRKREHACYNPDAIEIKHFVAHCECTERDYECDRGYRRIPLDGGVCVRDPDVPIDLHHLVPGYCQPGLHYHVSNGYRRVAGDSCVDGVQHEMMLLPCPGSKWHHSVSHHGWGVLILFFAVCTALGALTYCQYSLGQKGAKPFRGGGPGSVRSILPSWTPGWIVASVGFVVGRTLGGAVAVASLFYRAFSAMGGLFSSGGGGKRAGPGAGGSGSGGLSSRGFGIPASGSITTAGGSTGKAGAPLFSGVSYGQLGKDAADTLIGDDDDDIDGVVSSSTPSGTSTATGGDASRASLNKRSGAGGDDAFGAGGDSLLGGDEEEGHGPFGAPIGSGSRSAVAADDDAADADLLGLTAGGDASVGPLRGGGKGPATAAAQVPTLRPPRAHDATKKA